MSAESSQIIIIKKWFIKYCSKTVPTTILKSDMKIVNLHVDKKRILIDCLTGPVDAMMGRSGISLDKFFKTLYKRERIVDRIPLLLGVGGGGSHGDSGSQAKGGGL